MGTTPKPLNIIVFPPLETWPEIQKLKVQKHNVLTPGEWFMEGVTQLTLSGLKSIDLILGPRCWRMDETLRDYLDDAIAQARAVRYPKGEDHAGSTPE